MFFFVANRVPTRTRNREGIREQHKANMTLNNMAGLLFLTILLVMIFLAILLMSSLCHARANRSCSWHGKL